jgi:hypothetical protein
MIFAEEDLCDHTLVVAIVEQIFEGLTVEESERLFDWVEGKAETLLRVSDNF